MKSFLRCNNCLIPSIRPEQLISSDGICNACVSHENKLKINWKTREKEFFSIIKKYKTKNYWDCIVPSSGGKDSHYQAFKLRELGLKPLLVTATTCDLSEIGRKNLDNLKKNGFDTIEVSPDISTRKKLNKLCLEMVGDISWPEHVSIFTIPVQIAVKFEIPLIIWGENPQIEYGGPYRVNANVLDRKWLEEFGGLLGLRVEDLIEHHSFNYKDIIPYIYPEDKILKKKKICGIFLGYYFDWDNYKNFEVAKAFGFNSFYRSIENGYFNFEKLDNLQHGIHDYFKYLKYGFGRASDQLSFLIRKKMISRDDAYEIVKNIEGKFPKSYLGISTDVILNKIDLSMEKFKKICDEFTNRNIFLIDNNNNLIKDHNGDLILNENFND